MDKLLKMATGLSLVILLGSCEYDNYDEPDLTLDGHIVYQGDPIGVSYNDVSLFSIACYPTEYDSQMPVPPFFR